MTTRDWLGIVVVAIVLLTVGMVMAWQGWLGEPVGSRSELTCTKVTEVEWKCR